MIDHTTVERIVDVARIEEVVSDYVTLRKSGTNYKGLCPFHDEKTPSFMVSPAKGICKCFGCGKGGNAVNFVMEVEQISYVEALRYLAKKYNIEIQETEMSAEQIQQRNERESMLVLNDYARKYFSTNLQQHAEGKAVALSYFRSRGFRDDIIQKFQLGYCLDERDAFTRKALADGYNLNYMVKTGLTVKGENYTADRFKGRVMFPIHGLAGNVLAFGGRILKTDGKIAKYLNSPESEVYHKSRVLYGIYYAKRSIVKEDCCFLVEGYTDVISMHQSGIENVVASSGTALTPDQIRQINRFTKNITVLYDGDTAGIKASLRGIDLILEQGMNIKVLLLPDGEDPDSFAKGRSASEFKAYIEANQSDFIHFKTKLLLADAKNDPVKRAGLIQDIVRSISTIPDSITRSVYVKECSALLSIKEEALYSEINNIKYKEKEDNYRREQTQRDRQTYAPNTSSSQQMQQVIHPENLEEYQLVRLMMRFGDKMLHVHDENGAKTSVTIGPHIINEIIEDGFEFKHPHYKLIMDEYAANCGSDTFNPQTFFTRHQNVDITRLASDIFTDKYSLSKVFDENLITNEEDKLDEIVTKSLLMFKASCIKEMLDETNKTMQQMQNSGDYNNMMETMKELQALKEIQKEINELLGGRTIV